MKTNDADAIEAAKKLQESQTLEERMAPYAEMIERVKAADSSEFISRRG